VESPSLEIFQPRLAAVLCSLLWVTLLGQGVGLGDPQRSLPTPNILWFCDSSPLTAASVSPAPSDTNLESIQREQPGTAHSRGSPPGDTAPPVPSRSDSKVSAELPKGPCRALLSLDGTGRYYCYWREVDNGESWQKIFPRKSNKGCGCVRWQLRLQKKSINITVVLVPGWWWGADPPPTPSWRNCCKPSSFASVTTNRASAGPGNASTSSAQGRCSSWTPCCFSWPRAPHAAVGRVRLPDAPLSASNAESANIEQVLQNHRTPARQGLEGTSVGHLVKCQT